MKDYLHYFDSHSQWWFQHLILSLLLVIGVLILVRIVGRSIAGLAKWMGAHRNVSEGYAKLFQSVIKWLIWIFGFILILHVWGVDVTALWTAFVSTIAIIGVGLLAVWTMVSNITARFFIWFWRPMRLGQQIEIFPEVLQGIVVQENLMFTELRQEDGRIIVIPNNMFFQRVIRRSTASAAHQSRAEPS